MKQVGILTMVLMMACQGLHEPNPVDQFDDLQVREVLRRAVNAAGGWYNWSAIKTIHYTKHGRLFFADGTIESDLIQRHEYIMQPDFEAIISWEENGEQHVIKHHPSGTRKELNSQQTEEDPQKLYESVMSSLYVLGMPFKLLDAGTYLRYEGVATFRDHNADVLRATYRPEEFENHSTSDIWWYYFDAESGNFLGCMVYHAPTYALIHNIEFRNDLPVKFPEHRKSYRVDSTRTIDFLRAEFYYSDYQITKMQDE